MGDLLTSGNVLTVIAILLAIGIAIWQYWDAEKARAELESLLRSLPNQVLTSVQDYVNRIQRADGAVSEISSSDFQMTAKYADLDGDGKDELLIQVPFGPHNSQLRVFGFRDWDFKLIAELEVMAPSDYEVRDVDDDGRLEVVTVDQANTEFPYVCGFRDEVVYRLDKDTFIEIERRPLYNDKELEQGHVDCDQRDS